MSVLGFDDQLMGEWLDLSTVANPPPTWAAPPSRPCNSSTTRATPRRTVAGLSSCPHT
ncbi:hypothetical protein P1P92_44485 [Streptomyces ipomoeae]|nr:hypothetical protein [Streptomyces ipomoeae]MDX2939330.1 hypothetical protein [Streptomyces ipomoeae]